MTDLRFDDAAPSFLFDDTEVKIERPIESLDDYYKIDRMSNSRLGQFRQSPRHYLYSLTHFEETPAMVLGRAFHAIVLEEEKFFDMFYMIDDSRRPDLVHGMTSKENKAWKDSIDRKNIRKSFLKAQDYDTVQRMRDALYLDGLSNELFQEIHTVEKAIFWTDPVTGIGMKGKLDAVADDFTIDLKSCVNAKPEVFARHAWDFEYQGQAGDYRTARHIGTDKDGRPVKMNKGHFYFIAVEKTGPFGVSVNKASQKFISLGEDLNNGTREDFAYWREMGAPDVCYEWRKPFGYSTLNPPYWAK